MLRQHGAAWINADEIARDVLDDPAVIDRLVTYFGGTFLGSDGKIDRPRMAAAVFGDDAGSAAALKYLESLVHPKTSRRMVDQLGQAVDSGAQAAVLDVPLLFESGWDVWCDEVWLLDTPYRQVLAAASRRGWDEAELNRRLARQLALKDKRRLSTRVIDNSGSLERLAGQVESAWSELLCDRAAEFPPTKHCRAFLTVDDP